MLQSIRKYIDNTDTIVKILKNKINIINYNEIGNFDNNKIIIKGTYTITIIGNNLVINKLLNNELLITGKIDQINLGDK